MKRIPNKKGNLAPRKTQGAPVPESSSQYPHAPTSQPGSVKENFFYGNNPNSTTQGIQRGSSIRPPSTINTPSIRPQHAHTLAPSTQAPCAPTLVPRYQAPRAPAPEPSSQAPRAPTLAPRTQALSAPAPEPTTQPSIEVQYDGNGEDEYEEEDDDVIRTQVQNARRKGTWRVDIVDEHGTIKTKEIIVKDVWELPSNERIVLEWNGEGQPVGDSGGLLTRFLGPIGRDFSYFLISYENWKKVPREYKRIAYENDIEGKFDIQSDLQKSYVFKSLGLRWREHRQDLWNARDDNTRTRDELIAMAPEGVNRDHWATFVEYRLSEKTKLNAQKNKENRKKQTIHHTTGSKSLARKRAEMEKDFGRKVSRGEVWTAAHKRPDGTFVNDQAKEISEKIQEYENTMSLSQEISTQDSLAHALGSKEHCGRVRGLGLGPCPSQVFGHPSHYYSGMTSSSPSYTQLQNQVITLQSQVDEQNKKYDEQNKKFDALMSFLTHNFPGQLPLDLTMFQTTPVSDEGSAHPTNPTNDATHSPTNLEPEE